MPFTFDYPLLFLFPFYTISFASPLPWLFCLLLVFVIVDVNSVSVFQTQCLSSFILKQDDVYIYIYTHVYTQQLIDLRTSTADMEADYLNTSAKSPKVRRTQVPN
jgi:hypothetical protein